MKYKNIINALAVCGKAGHCNGEDCPFYNGESGIEDRSCQQNLMKSALNKLTKLHAENKQLKAIVNAYDDTINEQICEQDELLYTISQLEDKLQNAEAF